MPAANKVQLNYEEVFGIRDRFARQADVVNTMMQTVRSKMDVLQNGGWIGHGADAFFQEMQNEVLPGVQRLQSALTQASSELQRMSDHAREIEEAAAAVFRQQG
jgi:WXG100 family type VII secretion target